LFKNDSFFYSIEYVWVYLCIISDFESPIPEIAHARDGATDSDNIMLMSNRV